MNTYNSAAMLGSGKMYSDLMSRRVRKGSPEARMKMAYLRSLRTGKRRMKGGAFNPFGLITGGLKYWANYGKDWANQSKNDKAELERLRALKKQRGGMYMGPRFGPEPVTNPMADPEWVKAYLAHKLKGGKFELQDLRDGFMGPIGWIRMGVRKRRQREIEQLKKELGEE